MKIDRYTARALVDANLMSLREYIDKFGTETERDAGSADGLQVLRMRPASRPSKGRVPATGYGLPRGNRASMTVTPFHCH